MWGRQALCDHPCTFIDIDNVEEFIRTAKWYRGLTPPGRAPGGKGEFNFEGRGTGDPRWEFILGGFWLMRTWAIRAMDWPDRRLVNLGEDVLLGEAVRQQGWSIENAPKLGIAINQAPRRGPDGGLRANWGMKRRTESKLVQ
jgi:GT2 family glycosyltransferase